MSTSTVEIADHLSLQANAKILKMLKKYNEAEAKVLFSDFVIKINRKGKEQTRCILITPNALYNIQPRKHEVKRRISIANIVSVTVSDISDEFVVHIPDEYDYRYKSSKKDQIVSILREQVKLSGGGKLALRKEKKANLEDFSMNRMMSRLQTREQKLQRKKELAAIEHESDDEDRADAMGESRDHVSMLESNNKIRLKDFELLKVLGRGAFGKVMQVKKKSDGKVYAMKILKKSAIVERNQIEHTKAERAILQQLQHPFLMTLRYAFQSKDKLYLVLDYFQGGELFFHLKNQKRFPEEVARIYVAEIALAFGHLHSLGVVYRDLKPENILLDDKGHVCLTDFGLAKEIGDEKTQTFCGTPEYLAPEIIQGKGHDKAVDWWSLGILLYELTVGIPPFYSVNVPEMYNKIQHGVLKFPPFLSQACKSFIIALLHRDPTKRLGSVQDIEDVMAQEFFSEINWEKLYSKEIEVGFQPNVQDINDTSNFDKEFVSEPVIDSVVQASQGAIKKGRQEDFSGFTFTGDKKNTFL